MRPLYLGGGEACHIGILEAALPKSYLYPRAYWYDFLTTGYMLGLQTVEEFGMQPIALFEICPHRDSASSRLKKKRQVFEMGRVADAYVNLYVKSYVSIGPCARSIQDSHKRVLERRQ